VDILKSSATIKPGYGMVVNDEGALRDLPVNDDATLLAGRVSYRIHGVVILCPLSWL
jgi:hypothetical protein